MPRWMTLQASHRGTLALQDLLVHGCAAPNLFDNALIAFTVFSFKAVSPVRIVVQSLSLWCCVIVCHNVWCVLQVNTVLLAASHHILSVLLPDVSVITVKDYKSTINASVATEHILWQQLLREMFSVCSYSLNFPHMRIWLCSTLIKYGCIHLCLLF